MCPGAAPEARDMPIRETLVPYRPHSQALEHPGKHRILLSDRV